jgi:hypothetical protein
VDSLASNIILSLASAFVGAILGAFGSYGIWWLERLRQRRVARMQIAISLRRWLKQTLLQLSETRTHVDSDGAGGTLHSGLQSFHFEDLLDQVSLLEGPMTLKVFKLIHKKDAANDEVEAEHQYGDDDVATDIFRAKLARIWLRAIGIYETMAEQIGWSDRPFSDETKSTMQNEIGTSLLIFNCPISFFALPRLRDA